MIQEPETLYKLMTLYMLDRVNFPLTNSQLSQFFLDKNYTTYFTLQTVLNELIEARLISGRRIGNITYYEIADDGKEALRYFSSDISRAAVSDMDEYLQANKFSLRSEAGITAEYFKNSSGDYTISLSAREGDSTLISMDISVSDERAADAMCVNWRNCSKKIYSYIIHTLLSSDED